MTDLDMEHILTVGDVVTQMWNQKVKRDVANAIKDKKMEFFESYDSCLKLHVEILMSQAVYKSTKQQILWLTITKSNNCTIPDFVKLMHTLPTYRLTQEKFKYCFESTDYDDDFKNVHCHYLCLKQIGINKQQYIRRLEKLLKDKVFNINVQIYTRDYYDDKVDYLMGKKDADQYEKPEITQNLRNEYKLEPIY